jgi:hypothetical protein
MNWRAVLLADPCAYCGAPASDVDHIDPRDGENDGPDNLTACCRSCNARKNRRPLLGWLLVRNGNPHARPFAVRLCSLMRDRGVSVSALSARTGISPRMISRYRTGQNRPTVPYTRRPSENAVKIARELGVDVAVLLPPLDEEEAA